MAEKTLEQRVATLERGMVHASAVIERQIGQIDALTTALAAFQPLAGIIQGLQANDAGLLAALCSLATYIERRDGLSLPADTRPKLVVIEGGRPGPDQPDTA